MGSSKSKQSSPEVEVDKTNNNIGLVNLEENNIALLGPSGDCSNHPDGFLNWISPPLLPEEMQEINCEIGTRRVV